MTFQPRFQPPGTDAGGAEYVRGTKICDDAGELTYDPWDAAGAQVGETRRITIDAGQNLYRMETTFGGCDAPADRGVDCG